jgi:hypothetical protein
MAMLFRDIHRLQANPVTLATVLSAHDSLHVIYSTEPTRNIRTAWHIINTLHSFRSIDANTWRADEMYSGVARCESRSIHLSGAWMPNRDTDNALSISQCGIAFLSVLSSPELFARQRAMNTSCWRP